MRINHERLFFLIATDSIIIPVAHGDIASIRGAVLFK